MPDSTYVLASGWPPRGEQQTIAPGFSRGKRSTMNRPATRATRTLAFEHPQAVPWSRGAIRGLPGANGHPRPPSVSPPGGYSTNRRSFPRLKPGAIVCMTPPGSCQPGALADPARARNLQEPACPTSRSTCTAATSLMTIYTARHTRFGVSSKTRPTPAGTKSAGDVPPARRCNCTHRDISTCSR